MQFIGHLYWLVGCFIIVWIKRDTDPVLLATVMQYSLDSSWMNSLLEI